MACSRDARQSLRSPLSEDTAALRLRSAFFASVLHPLALAEGRRLKLAFSQPISVEPAKSSVIYQKKLPDAVVWALHVHNLTSGCAEHQACVSSSATSSISAKAQRHAIAAAVAA